MENNSVSLIYNLLRYYEEGKTQPVEEKSLIQERIGKMKIYGISFYGISFYGISFYGISFYGYSDEFDSFDSDSVIDNFVTNVWGNCSYCKWYGKI